MKRVLIAEDDAFIREIAEAKLAEVGFEIQHVEDGNAVLATLAQYNPDILLLDLTLPHKHGFEILEEIRATDRFETLPVVIFSNETGKLVEQKAKDLNATYFFKAMTGTGELVQTIQGILN